ncbi:MAG: hypothetical protein QOE55_7818 [Acidobacteriaceae bacterium]|nr:hypothetical protein [Acidobacteriaceae bacterium]
MLVGRCSSQLSDHQNPSGNQYEEKNPKSHNRRAKPTCPAMPRRAVGLAAEGSAVPRTSIGNVFFKSAKN